MSKHDEHGTAGPRGDDVPASTPRRRFRLEKLEERIAPAGHYNTQSKWVGGGGGGSSGSSGWSGDTSGSY
jgi:hypothetical protein